MKTMGLFMAKVRGGSKVSHYWRGTEIRGEFAAICNPGLVRNKDELHETTGIERLCKVCRIHM
jgi:hypothetical protein